MYVHRLGDAEQPSDACVCGAGFNPLDSEPLYARQITQSLLREVGVDAMRPDSVADDPPLLKDPVGFGVARHSTNGRLRTIMSQPMQACFI